MTTPLSNTDKLREMTKQSIARLVAHRRGAEKQDGMDEITASNILMVCSRLIKQSADTLATEREREADVDARINELKNLIGVKHDISDLVLVASRRIKTLRNRSK